MPILFAHIVDHLGAPVLAQVDVDVGIFRAVGIGEPFKEQAVLHGARVGQAEQIADHRADAGASRVGGDSLLAPPVDEVPHDQEVRRDRFVDEDAEFAVQAGANLLLPLAFFFISGFGSAGSEAGAVAPDESRLA